MLTRVVPAALLVAVVGWTTSSAQPLVPGSQPSKESKPDGGKASGPAAKIESKKDLVLFEIRMVDDTVMKVSLMEPALVIATRYGKLMVPVAEVRRLEFGFRYPDGTEVKIDKAIADLASPEFRTREDAEQTLANIGQFAVPALRRASKSEDAEVNRRSKTVLKLLESKLALDQLELRDHDTIETAEFTIKGRMDISALKVRTKYFGDATVRLSDIRTFRSVVSASASEFALDAAKYAKMNQADWLETAIEVSAGQQLEVTATGKIDQWPQGPGQYMSEPGGLPGHAGGGVVVGGMPRIGVPGQVVGRIGANGTPFVIGASYKGKVTENGKLYVRISPSPWNCDSTGAYKISANVTTP
ncbi:Uncharacterized protein OS=Pirellula staleyi (strain ATCC 27377 / DSM 6068 / ICPB 4128) GN=Psta_2577 PE=4 SV=1 [Gemmata massiliana]|uniref:Uncharacterized protein n=1 Tax=Gemmata massiliana TaxID=1210884 RepID=A0A6P2DKD6_9BACT|nr:hypothetical protein [Gemmata massiliana]VTS03075.1 Uncharacterized protein OS=Pirellula staleyi (strain ATCC 27377 / DSM 6068 / ICPB 4128) GN=Psta_2577 PE=4 SV=1 [Gemmata massiliana]